MKKYKYLLGTSLLLGSFTAPLFAEEPKSLYLSIGGGVNFISDIEGEFEGTTGAFETDNPFIYSIAIGKEFDDWRLEFNYLATTVTSDSIQVTVGGNGSTATITPDYEIGVSSYMLYAYKDIPGDSKFTPYFGAGLGVSSVEQDAETYSILGNNVNISEASESVFTFGLKGGVGYEIAENTSLYSEASYLNYASFTTDAGEEMDSNNSFVISTGLRFSF